MKTARTFKGGRFLLVTAIALVLGEFVAWRIRPRFEINPVVVGFVSVGLVALAMSIIYEGADVD